LLALVLALGVLAAPAAADVVVGFRTPTGNIGCVYSRETGKAPYLRCDIRSRLRPTPPRPRNCVDLDWGDSYEMRSTGRVGITCHGDTAIDPRNPVVRYGSTWRRGGFVCASTRAGLRCRNRSGHGFFLSRQHSYRF